ncbi:hypothetical protein CAEBREN_17354 [Caenorhabditis brenneri]|uniref:Uncharacterized protein n=1 Tax=Caenorhabditis brenneri TaxID=135651 RepID=G0MWY0_CAEBE|nr:hypothetical protein CAEBREN_17354 [Caenorhabditis brenneri]
MRLLVLFVLFVLLKRCIGGSGKKITGTIKAEFGFHCPDKTDWEFKISSHTSQRSAVEISVKATNHFEFRTIEKEFTVTYEYVHYIVEHTCSTDGKWKIRPPLIKKVEENKIVYFVFGMNLKSGSDHSVVLEKLFIHYLKKECPTGDCSAIRERVSASCKLFVTEIEKTCIDKYEKALKLFLEERFTSTQTSISTDATTGKSNTTTFIIVGSAVGVLLLISRY